MHYQTAAEVTEVVREAIMLTLNDRDLQQAFQFLIDHLSDLTPLWDRILEQWYIVQTENIFDTDGLGTWDATSRPNPILRDTYRLFESYTDPNHPDFIWTTTEFSLAYGSNVPYSDWHEDGTSKLKKRQVIALLDQEDAALDVVLQDWINDLDSILEDILARIA